QLDAGAARLGQADGDRLFRRSRAVLAFTHVMYFLADELSRLRRRRLPRSLVLLRAFPCSCFGHGTSVRTLANATCTPTSRSCADRFATISRKECRRPP